LQYIALIGFFLVMLLVCGLTLWWFFYCKRKPEYNGFLWLHPDLGGAVIGIQKEPAKLQNPFFFNYRILEFGIPYFRQELYFWSQDKITDTDGKIRYPIIQWEPTIPADYLLPATGEGEPDKAKPYITPNELYDTTDWDCLKKLETAKSSLTETIKLGVAVVMACVCVFGIIMALDMIGKKEPAQQPVQTAKPMTQIIQPQNYGGLLIW
jgi:hypothetical protein